jgi:hypothetical protein
LVVFANLAANGSRIREGCEALVLSGRAACTKPLLCAGRFISTKFNLKTMDNLKDLLEEFIDWARDCGEDAFYIFENTDEAIEKFFEQRDE